MFSRRTFDNGEEIRRIYLLHTLNHILKARSRVLKNNARLTLAAKKNREIEYVMIRSALLFTQVFDLRTAIL